jgi:hypothetical protein
VQPSGRLLVVLWTVAIAAIVTGFILLFDDEGPVAAVAVVNRAVGGSFIFCGLIAWQRRPDSRSGALMTLTGFLYLGGQLLDDIDWPPAYTLGEAIALTWLVSFGALVLGYPTGRLSRRIDCALVGAWVLGTAVWQLVWLAFLPFPEGRDNLLMISAQPDTADTIDTLQRSFNCTVGIAVAAVAALVVLVLRVARRRRR